MRLAAASIVFSFSFFLAADADAQCSRFDLFPAEGLDRTLLSDLERRLELSGLSSTGELADCPVRLQRSGDDVLVHVELEDRIVTRRFAAQPPREAAWAIAVLLEELVPDEVRGGPRDVPPPEEIVPGPMFPEEMPDLEPSEPRLSRPVRPARPRGRIWIAVGPRIVQPIRGVGEPIALSLQAAVLPTRLTLVVSADFYLPDRQRGDVKFPDEDDPRSVPVDFWSIQPAIGAGYEIFRRGRLVASAQALILGRVRYADPDPGENLSVQKLPGFMVRTRLDLRLLPWLAAGLGLGGAYLPAQYLTNRRDLRTAPWEVGGGIDGVILL